MRLAAPEVGERRGYFVSGTFKVPHDCRVTPDQLEDMKVHHVKRFIERLAKQGEQFERVVSITKAEQPLPDHKWGMCDEYVIRMYVSRRAARLKFDLSDEVVRTLLTRYPHKYNERMVS